jgi:parallel beta-helix repeat protein
MKQYIRNDFYLELLDVPNFEFVCADHYSIHGVASEQGPALVSTPNHTLDSLVNVSENSADDNYLAFYIRPCPEENVIINNT